MKLPTATEHEIQQTIINFLKYKGYYVQRLNTGVIRSTYKGRDRMIRMSAKGTPDIMAFRPLVISKCSNGGLCSKIKLIFIEVKRPGKIATFAQEQMMKELESYGARCIVATCIEDVEQAL